MVFSFYFVSLQSEKSNDANELQENNFINKIIIDGKLTIQRKGYFVYIQL